MSNILLFTDSHVHTHKSSLKRLQHCLDALKWVFETAVDRNIQHVVFLGDLFQDREKIQVLSYQRTYEIIEKYCGGKDHLNLYMLIGNHDMWFADKTDVSSIYPFGSIDGVRIIQQCETLNIAGLDIDFLPFALNPLKSIQEFKKPSRLLCGHIALDGAQLNTLYKTQADVSVEYDGDMVKVDAKQFKTWEKVLLGHYHGEQRIGNIEYIGSPLQLNYAEAFQKKHIIILDTENLDIEYVENRFSPRHIIITEGNLDKYNIENCFVKFQPKDISASWILDFKHKAIEEQGALSFEISAPKVHEDTTTKEKIEDAKSVFSLDREEMLQNYMQQTTVPNNLNFDKLLGIGKDIMQKSQVG